MGRVSQIVKLSGDRYVVARIVDGRQRPGDPVAFWSDDKSQPLLLWCHRLDETSIRQRFKRALRPLPARVRLLARFSRQTGRAIVPQKQPVVRPPDFSRVALRVMVSILPGEQFDQQPLRVNRQLVTSFVCHKNLLFPLR